MIKKKAIIFSLIMLLGISPIITYANFSQAKYTQTVITKQLNDLNFSELHSNFKEELHTDKKLITNSTNNNMEMNFYSDLDMILTNKISIEKKQILPKIMNVRYNVAMEVANKVKSDIVLTGGPSMLG